MEDRRVEKSKNEEMRSVISRPPLLRQSYPWLVIFDGDKDSRQTFYCISRNHYYVRYIPEMNNKFIVSSQHGWLFLEDNISDDCFLFNMFTLEKKQLPPLMDRPDANHNSVLSSWAKIDSTCRILVIMANLRIFRSCYFGDSEFVERELSCDSHVGAVINFEGKLYALTFCDYDLLVADFADPELRFTPIIRGHKSLNQMIIIGIYIKFYLVESCGELLFIYTNYLDHDGLDIKIYKADFVRKEWMEVKCLGNRALFLDFYKGFSSSSTASECGLRSNCVYYVNVNADTDRNLYVYDLEDESITMYLPSPICRENPCMFWAI